MNKQNTPEQEYRVTHERIERWVVERPEFLGEGHNSTSQDFKLMRHGDMMPADIPRRRRAATVYGKESKSYKPQGLTKQEANLDRYRISKSIERIYNGLPRPSRRVIRVRYLEGVTSKAEIERKTGINRKGFDDVLCILLSWFDQQLAIAASDRALKKSA